MKTTTIIKLAALFVGMPLLLNACNTMSGAGEDISKGGEKLQKEADQNKNY